jgi:2-keto-4-pentenoate hydratase/2-oxohepta-3-ene-1,7-dioic acid hydratase in catechol pathway
MRIARFLWDEKVRWGVIEGDEVHAISGDLFGSFRPGQRLCTLGEVKLLAPVAPGNKIIGIGRNYRPKEVRAEQDGPGVFLKSPTGAIAHREPIVYPKIGKRVIYEGELALVIGKTAKHVSVDEALNCVLGYSCANDITVPEFTTKDDPLFSINHKGKFFDTHFPFGPWLETNFSDPNDAHLQLRQNGVVKQDASTSQMTWNVQECISFVSDIMTLYPGDVISTASPPGLEPIQPGDVLEVEIDGIGVLHNPVIAEAV